MKKIVNAERAPAALGPYSQAVVAGGFVFAAGQIGLAPGSDELPGDVAGQTRRAMENLGEVLAAAGAGFGDVVKTTIFLADLGDFAEVNEVYAAYFAGEPPARSTVQAAALPKGALVEIEMVAYVGKG